ncbi:S8 family serine peptidase [Arenibaculum sp.]|uniref:S8 family serine peptidase n=1 Tax=Arenibaculum sp. TaxID=2865862 RepID=UPI002E15DA99|nr:S8 family serine peptidase [Arenibaculum sp.]
MPDNPVLRLKMVATREGVKGRGKSEDDIYPEFRARQRALFDTFAELLSDRSERVRWFSGRTLFWVKMADSSLATSWTPKDLLSRDLGIAFAAPWHGGYAVEVPLSCRTALLQRIKNPGSIAQRVDISRIAAVVPLQEAVAAEDLTPTWRAAAADERGRRQFVAYLAPFVNPEARGEVVDRLGTSGLALLISSAPQASLLTSESAEGAIDFPAVAGGTIIAVGDARASLLARAKASMQKGNYPRLVAAVAEKAELVQLVGSGTIVRWDPIAPLVGIPPGDGPEPEPDPDNPLPPTVPTVGEVDGGITARRYGPDVAWRAPAFLPRPALDHNHANCVAGVLREAEDWNNHLDITSYPVRLGDVPVVPRNDFVGSWDMAGLIAYLDRTIAANRDTKVWNISANMPAGCDRMRVSEFGHQMSRLARKHSVLFVISSGNRPGEAEERIAPPADAEAAITVSGRLHNGDGRVGEPCHISRVGLGPEEMLKPELSWFSSQRLLGGRQGIASSFAAPLVSRIAAHTWANLKQPTPDLVKALLINAADQQDFHYRTGYGSPISPVRPWLSGDNAVIFCWQQSIVEKRNYYWSGIQLPPSLTRGGKFKGRVKLVAILAPVTHALGTNYASTRIEATVQYRTNSNKWERLVGSMSLETPEGVARTEDAKWQPIRVYSQHFPRGKTFGQNELRLRARLFWRDRYLYPGGTEAWPVTATFVVMLESFDADHRVYDEFVAAMGTQVEAAVIEPVIETDVEG